MVGDLRTEKNRPKPPKLRNIKSEEYSVNLTKGDSITVCPLERTPSAPVSTPIFDFSEPHWSKFSSEVSEFINQCLDENDNRRPTASELL